MASKSDLLKILKPLFRDDLACRSELADMALAGFVTVEQVDIGREVAELTSEEAAAIAAQSGGEEHQKRCQHAAAWILRRGRRLLGPQPYHHRPCGCGLRYDVGTDETKVECGMTYASKVLHVMRTSPWLEVVIASYEGGDWAFRGPAFVREPDQQPTPAAKRQAIKVTPHESKPPRRNPREQILIWEWEKLKRVFLDDTPGLIKHMNWVWQKEWLAKEGRDSDGAPTIIRIAQSNGWDRRALEVSAAALSDMIRNGVPKSPLAEWAAVTDALAAAGRA